jgi:hypothetical protein
MELKKLTLTDFKGVRKASYDFYHKTLVSAENGSGKTTILDSYMWLMANMDSQLNSNPAIRPNDGRECEPMVEAEFEIDGKTITFSKTQKRKESKPDVNGVKAISDTNFFTVNAVEVSKTNFEKKLEEYGIRLDIFAELTHPDLFLRGMGQKKDNDRIRAVLMPMASDHSDLEIATANNLTEVAKLLESYSVEEITAMQNSSLRKIREEYGKDGEILRAKIEGMELSKVDIDVAELELEKNRLTEELKEIQSRQGDLSKELEYTSQLQGGIFDKEREIRHIQSIANEDNRKKRQELIDKRDADEFLVTKKEDMCSRLNRDIESNNKRNENLNTELEKLRDEYKRVSDLEFDENSLVCAYCGQEYPEDKKEQIRADFEQKKHSQLEEISRKGNEYKDSITDNNNLNSEHNDEVAKLHDEIDKLRLEIIGINEQLSGLPEEIFVDDRDDVIVLRKEIADLQAKYDDAPKDVTEAMMKNRQDIQSINDKLTEVEKQIALFSRNTEIDEQIAGLRTKQIEYEQNKANCEKVLYQLDLLARAKNELVADDINSHFKLVDFKLFTYAKNGEYKSCCIPMIDGYELGTCTNKGREVLAKLDIIRGLQDFYGVNYPVILDDFERLSDTTIGRIDMDCQLIMLKVSEDKEIAVREV